MSDAWKFIFGAIVVMLLVVATIGAQFKQFLSTPVDVHTSAEGFEISSGMSFHQVSAKLNSRGIISNPAFFRLYARISGDAELIQAGEYLIESGLTPVNLIDKFVSGDVRLYSFTAVEGWTFRNFLKRLTNHTAIDPSVDYSGVPALLEWLGTIEAHPEGLFFPETYHFPKGTSDKDILKKAYKLMADILSAEWDQRANGLPLRTPYEALILASIIEKETALAKERPEIAGVFLRRLQAGMRLQTDPTVIYGIGESFDGNLTRTHLQTDTPYNTYTRRGLPPTPIALPGRASIRAALRPAIGTALYFVATGLGDGSHKFSDTKEEHDRAVQEFLMRRRLETKRLEQQ